MYENRPDANGRLPLAALKAAPGDGHVLRLVNDGLPVSQPIVDQNSKLEPAKDYEIVGANYAE